MFGEYAQIASYLSSRDGYGSTYDPDPLPDYLRPPPYNPGLSWELGREKNGLKEDFIMIAEFSELEGPKPVMTIPKDGGENFDQNMFSVRILATDHQAQNEVGFSISEDAQVVLSDYDTGVFAFVHHFVLYDNTARGFVRPYCIAFITNDQRKLMECYEEISSQMKKVARLFKYGNLLLFVGDLERHLKDLDHTKTVLLTRVSKMRLKESEVRDGSAQDIRKNAENELHRALQSIHQSTSEIKDILVVLRPLLSDKRLEDRFRLLEERAYQDASASVLDKLSLQENWFNDLSSLPCLDAKGGSGSLKDARGDSPLSLFRARDHKPLLVETKKANRFNAPLRGLHELCSWGAKEGLRKLRHVQEYFKRDMVIIAIEKTESKLFHPGSTGVFCGQCVTGNFLHGVKRLPYSMLDEVDSFNPTELYDWVSTTSLDSLESYKSADESLTFNRAGNPSPCSFQTVDSQNGQIFLSYPSSINNGNSELCLGEEGEYYPELPEVFNDLVDKDQDVATQQQDDITPTADSHNAFQPSADVSTKTQSEPREVPVVDKSNWRLSMDLDDDPPPLVIFQESIKRPFSVISLGCQDESNGDVVNNESVSAETITGRPRSHNVSVSSDLSCSDFPKAVQDKEDDISCQNVEDVPCRVKEETSPQIADKHSPKCLNGGDKGKNKWCQSSPIPVKSVSRLQSQSLISSSQLSKNFEEGTSILVSPPVASQAVSSLMPSSTPPSNSPTIRALFPSLGIQRSSSSPAKVSKRPSNSFNQTAEHSSWNDSDSDIAHQYSTSQTSSFTNLSLRDFTGLTERGVLRSTSIPVELQSHPSMCEDDPTCADCPDENTHLSAGVWRPRHGLYTLGDWLNNLSTGKPGHCLMEVVNSYNNLQHVIFSLLSGRPVLVIGTPKMEPEVVKVVNALAAFVPSTKRKRHTILEWTSKPLRISDLTKLRLVGVCRPERRTLDSIIPYAIKKASSILDVDRKLISAPQYQGQLIHSMLAKRKCLKTEPLLLSHIQWWMMDLMAKAYIFFHSFCLGSAGSIVYSHGLREHRANYCKTVSGILGRLGVRDSDCSIVEYMAELAKLSYLEMSNQIDHDSGTMSQPLQLRFTVCQTFRC